MPALSPTMSQGNVASWQVSEGAEISAGDILADIETDKATLPWENQDDGFIAKLLKPGGSKDIPVGTPLVVLVEEKEHIGDFKDFSPEGASAGADASEQTEQQAGALLCLAMHEMPGKVCVPISRQYPQIGAGILWPAV